MALLLLFALSGLARAEGDAPIAPIMSLADATASAVAWSPDGTELAVGDANGISLYTSDLQLIRSMAQPTEEMVALDWSPDGKYLASYGANDVGHFDPNEPRQTTVYIWDVKSGELITAFDKHTFYVPALAWSPDGSKIATGSWDRTIRIWNPLTGVVENTMDAPEHPGDDLRDDRDVISLSWSFDGRLAVLTLAPALFVWDDLTHAPRELIPPHLPPNPYIVVWSPDAKFIAIGTGIYNVAKSEENYFKNCPGATVWSPNGYYTAGYGSNGVYICKPFTDNIITVLQGNYAYQDGVVLSYENPLDWSPNGNLLAGAAGDGYVRIWDVSHLAVEDATPES